jgi:NagD protein
LKNAGLGVAIASNNHAPRVELFNQKLGVFATCESKKPFAKSVKAACKHFGVKPEETAVIGDRIYTDLEMARRAKIPGVLVLTGEATLETLKEAGWTPELVLDDISVLADLLVEAKTKKK